MVGNCAARLKRMAARASRKRASATFKVWLEPAICSSSLLSSGSPKISHQFPRVVWSPGCAGCHCCDSLNSAGGSRSEEHTSELQSHSDLVCRLLLEKKKKKRHILDSMNMKM